MIIVVTPGIFINNMRVNKKNTIILVSFLAFLTGILFFWKVFIQKPTKEELLLPSPTPTPIIATPIPKFLPKQKIIDLLPIITENYTIEYLPKPDKIFVLILSEPFEEYQNEIKEWFHAQGVENLEELDISWGSARRGVAPEYQP